MSRRTKKVGTAGRFGPRYGVRIRRRILETEEGLRGWHVCPRCGVRRVKRRSSGVWICRHCGLVFAGGAYRPIVTTSVKREAPPSQVVESKTAEEAQNV